MWEESRELTVKITVRIEPRPSFVARGDAYGYGPRKGKRTLCSSRRRRGVLALPSRVPVWLCVFQTHGHTGDNDNTHSRPVQATHPRLVEGGLAHAELKAHGACGGGEGAGINAHCVYVCVSMQLYQDPTSSDAAGYSTV